MLSYFFLGSAIACTLVTAIYRLHLHPLSKYPGPRIAAITGLYEIYFLARGSGAFEGEIIRLHQRYGPVVRITPDEVHVQEQQVCDASYAECWIKGNRGLDGRHPPSIHNYPVGKRSILRVLQGSVTNVLQGLVEAPQRHRGPRSTPRVITPMSFLRSEIMVPPTGSDEIGSEGDPLSGWLPGVRPIRIENRSRHGRTLYSTVQSMSRRSLPFST